MKKIILSLLMSIILGFSLVSCSNSDIKTIDPDIIGCGTLQEKDGFFFVEIDSIYFSVTSLMVGGFPSHNSQRVERLLPFIGKEITCFRAKQWQAPQFVLGKMDKNQVEFLYHKEPISPLTIVIVFALILVIFIFSPKEDT